MFVTLDVNYLNTRNEFAIFMTSASSFSATYLTLRHQFVNPTLESYAEEARIALARS